MSRPLWFVNLIKKSFPQRFRLARLTHLPVIVDPSHATGRRSLVPPMAKAALVVGAHGIMVEVHPEPDKALSDGPQSLTIPGFERLMDEIRKIDTFLGY